MVAWLNDEGLTTSDIIDIARIDIDIAHHDREIKVTVANLETLAPMIKANDITTDEANDRMRRYESSLAQDVRAYNMLLRERRRIVNRGYARLKRQYGERDNATRQAVRDEPEMTYSERQRERDW